MYDVIPVTSPRETDCGATCLKMLLDYYGIDVSLDQLTKELETRLIGCSAADIMRVARAHGLDDMQSYSIDADELVRQDRPAIIHWKYNHWCVFCGCDDEGRVSIANPDRGRFRMSFGTFAALFTGLDDRPDQGVAIFNGEPHDNGEPEPVTVSDLAEAMVDISEAVSDNADAIADLSEVVSDLAGGDING